MQIELKHYGDSVAVMNIPETSSLRVASLATDIAKAILIDEQVNSMKFDLYINSRHHAEFTLRKTVKVETFTLVKGVADV